ncbi:DNA N-6-adenine-methyltransferase [Sphingomonas sp. BK345]|uniref:DNA N-6-adenine-methyltransferase n=1 Tax=Sphingomonas sp. BK345 TaxID=2586980 RepID=UPI0016222C2C|nr:DNA N-6-adenine-methyltransferase [Sphingomonas sp. BK345]MBB3472782.1 glycosyltransferase involved in cell wall biosynthesis [Sphingomonas sp. BK345]
MVIRARKPKTLANAIVLKDSDNRFTSPALIRAIERSFGRIDFDPCWHPASAVRPRAHLDVRRGDDGLRDDWSGDVVFVNPPWSKQKRWLERAHDQWSKHKVGTAVCLVPAKTDTGLFHHVLSKEADVYFIEGRPHFFREDGRSEATMVSAMVVMFGATPEQKRRFAERVRGSWWLPSRLATDFTGRIPGDAPRVATTYPVISCAAPPRGNGSRIVLCAPGY